MTKGDALFVVLDLHMLIIIIFIFFKCQGEGSQFLPIKRCLQDGEISIDEKNHRAFLIKSMRSANEFHKELPRSQEMPISSSTRCSDEDIGKFSNL
ncbi:hypothetical protein QVD17_37831 [Tagetes erecta]|uniref:Uncharacterized protein n=1 Tax=Tagetes erecta TaxID=13708 RepID=A0AAD8JX45_TARER|nr:hypothetical protein QVD17_37831 [Tagetes erecta]